jgi:2-polyprenyl-3-methyl-5-hydroxy-6-metoxy-1,4-benzoquinol methylase
MIDFHSISTKLTLSEDGIWRSTDQVEVSYPRDSRNVYLALEDSSFWFQHRNRCIINIVKKYPPGEGRPIFDIGGGNGFVSKGLAEEGFDMVLVEPGYLGAANAKRRGLASVVCATTETAGFKRHSLPAVGLFDVLEHIEDDIGFLRSLKDLISRQGRIYLTVPAFQFLWSDEDVSARHARRYRLKDLCKSLETAGFEIEYSSYFFRFLPLPVFLLRTLPFKLGLAKSTPDAEKIARAHMTKGRVIPSVLRTLLEPEIHAIKQGKVMKFGGSCLVVARAS